MNQTNHKANAGSFSKGQDQRRHKDGQTNKEAVALGALLKKYLVLEASKPPRWGEHETNARALAAEIWEQACAGKFPFVQFLADRLMGKMPTPGAAQDDEPPQQPMFKFACDTIKQANKN